MLKYLDMRRRWEVTGVRKKKIEEVVGRSLLEWVDVKRTDTPKNTVPLREQAEEEFWGEVSKMMDEEESKAAIMRSMPPLVESESKEEVEVVDLTIEEETMIEEEEIDIEDSVGVEEIVIGSEDEEEEDVVEVEKEMKEPFKSEQTSRRKSLVQTKLTFTQK